MKVEFEQIILGQIYSRNNPYEQKITCRVFQRIMVSENLFLPFNQTLRVKIDTG